MAKDKTGGGVGTNQYQVRGQTRRTLREIPAPDLMDQLDDQVEMTCGQAWGNGCTHIVQPPNYRHGTHPTKSSELAASSDSDTPPGVLLALCGSNWTSVRTNIASNTATPATALDILAQDIQQVREAVAAHPSTAVSTLVRLCDDRETQVLCNLAHRQPIHKSLVQALLRRTWLTPRFVAENPSTPREVLAQLAEHGNVSVVEKVASNPNTSPETLSQIMRYPDITRYRDARMQAIQNPNLPEEELERVVLRDTPDATERAAIASSSHITVSLGYRLASDSLHCMEVARNPHAPPEVLDHIAKTRPTSGRDYLVARNPNTSAETLYHLWRFGEPVTRVAVLNHPNLPEHLRSLGKVVQT